jgi:hypothetical protein
MVVQGKSAVEAAVAQLKPDVEAALGCTFDQFQLCDGLSPIHAIIGISYHWRVQQVSDEKCVHLRIFENPQTEGLHILAIKLTRMDAPFEFLDPRFGAIQK